MDEKEQERVVEEKPPVKAKAEPKPIPVRIIRDNGPTALVEWAVGSAASPDWCRAYVPKEVIQHLGDPSRVAVAQVELDAGTSYGVRWEQFAHVTATPQKIGAELRRRGIWTLRDFDQNVMTAQAAFFAAYGADFGTMLQAARKQEE